MIVLKRVIQYFPKYKSTARSLEKSLAKLLEATDKNDLLIMANVYKGMISEKMDELQEEPSVKCDVKN